MTNLVSVLSARSITLSRIRRTKSGPVTGCHPVTSSVCYLLKRKLTHWRPISVVLTVSPGLTRETLLTARLLEALAPMRIMVIVARVTTLKWSMAVTRLTVIPSKSRRILLLCQIPFQKLLFSMPM